MKQIRTVSIIIMVFCCCLSAQVKADDNIAIADGIIDTTLHATLGLQPAIGTETITVFSPTDASDHYANGVVLTAFRNVLYCMWQSSPCDEDSDDTWVAYSRSTDDGLTWSPPQPLTSPTSTHYFTSGGWLVCSDTLTAFVDAWEKSVTPRGGSTLFTTTTNGLSFTPLQPVSMADGTPVRGVLEQDPYRLPCGRLVGACHFQPGLHICPVFTDDPTGHSGWRRASFESEDRGAQSRELEPSQYVTADGTIVMLFRDQQSSFRKLVSISTDNGASWTKPIVSNIPDARTKQCAGNLPDGTAYMVACPVPAKRRWPLVLLLSADGHTFSQAFLLRSGADNDLPPRHYDGKAKTSGYSYPKAFVHNGALYVGYSVNKETVELTRIPLSSLVVRAEN